MTVTDSPAGPPPRQRGRRLRQAALAGPLALVAVLGVLYAAGDFGKATDGACKGSAATTAKLDPLVRGEIAALGLAREGKLAPDLAFKGPDGAPKTLADFRGQTVLLNLWATWCVPCRKEMPSLDRLQTKLGGPDFQVVAVNIDTAKLDRPKQFLADTGVTLPLYTDSTATIFQTLRGRGEALGLPTTVIVDRQGCEIGTLAGPAAWDSAEAEQLIQAAKGS